MKIKNKKNNYTLIVPSLDRKGPINVATDIGMAAVRAGWTVKILYLTNILQRDDLGFATEVRKFSISDLWSLNGVVHTHGLRPDLLAFILSLNKKVTLINTIHIFFLEDLKFTVKNKLLLQVAWITWKTSLKYFDHVCCISESMRKYYADKMPAIKFELVYNFRSSSGKFMVERTTAEWIALRKSLGDVVLVFVGVLYERKNIVALVTALKKTKSISLAICGSGPLHNILVKKIKDNGLYDKVRLLGNLESPSSVIRLADALILPSHAEGFPLVVIEAASVGVPSLLSDIEVHRELVGLGFGAIIDHIHFENLEKAAFDLRYNSPAPSQLLIDIWSNKFTPECGFRRYIEILNSSSR
jgi:glycosyltransferase involved in cell wall biosynthesis